MVYLTMTYGIRQVATSHLHRGWGRTRQRVRGIHIELITGDDVEVFPHPPFLFLDVAQLRILPQHHLHNVIGFPGTNFAI